MRQFRMAKFEFRIGSTALFILALALALLMVPRAAEAQPAGKVFSLGILNPHPPRPPGAGPTGPEWPFRVNVIGRLKELGWIEGQNLKIEYAFGEGREERLPQLAEDLVRRRVDVIWATGPLAALAAKRATTTIPIVFWGVNYPVELGLVSNIARPGGNVTGVAYSVGPELYGKQLEFLRQIAPAATRLAWINIAGLQSPEMAAKSAIFQAAVRGLGFEFSGHIVSRSEDFDPLFASLLAARIQAIGLVGDHLTIRESKRIVQFANQNRLPSAFGMKEFVQVGGLVSYSANLAATQRQSALYIDKIFRGARPGDLPVEQPDKYELWINQGTAKALGLSVPQSLLLLADEVIQ